MVVQLQQRPAEHFLGGQQVVDVGAVVVCAGVAGAVGVEGREGGGVAGRPHVEAEGEGGGGGGGGEGEGEGEAGVGGGGEEG